MTKTNPIVGGMFLYHETCVRQASVRPAFVFGVDMCLVYTGSAVKRFPTLGLYLKFSFFRIPVYSLGLTLLFGIDRRFLYLLN